MWSSTSSSFVSSFYYRFIIDYIESIEYEKAFLFSYKAFVWSLQVMCDVNITFEIVSGQRLRFRSG